MARCPFCENALSIRPTTAKHAEVCGCPSCLNPCIVTWKDGTAAAAPLAEAPDIRTIAAPDSMAGEIFGRLKKAVESLPLLPEISQQILDLVRKPDTSIAELAKLVNQDSVIAVKILNLANSAVYGGLHPVKDLTTACARLGMKTVANAVQAIAAGNLYITGEASLRDLMRALWRHGVATAHCAHQIALTVSERRPDALFVAGLVHDIGKVVLLDIVSGKSSGVLAALRNSPQLLMEVMESYHALIGLHVIQHWNLPAEFAMTTYFHHCPEQAPDQTWLPMTHIVALADRVATISGHGTAELTQGSLVGHPSARFLGLSDLKLAAIRVDLEDRLESVLEILAE